eukprot:144821-Pyramimonas_sp.AAC.1
MGSVRGQQGVRRAKGYDERAVKGRRTAAMAPGGRFRQQFSRWTNQTHDTRVYSHEGPIKRRKRGYILTKDQSDAGNAGRGRAAQTVRKNQSQGTREHIPGGTSEHIPGVGTNHRGRTRTAILLSRASWRKELPNEIMMLCPVYPNCFEADTPHTAPRNERRRVQRSLTA